VGNQYFGTDGIRGVFGADLTESLAFRTGRAIVRYFGKGEFCIGRDSRTHGEALLNAVAAGIACEGGRPLSIGILPTPACAYFTKRRGAACGVVISASHNPPEYNGIKLFCNTGLKVSEEREGEIERIMDGLDEVEPTPVAVAELATAQEEYVEYLVSTCARRLDGLRVRLDCGWGACAHTARRAFERLGATVTACHDGYDGARINVGVGALHPEVLLGSLADGEIGFSFDGDGDRLCVVTDGEVIDGDTVIYYLSKSLELEGNTVVGTILNNLALEEALRRDGVAFVRTPVGDKYISNKMFEEGYSLGGEQSGHFIINSYLATGDAILSALYLLGILLGEDGSLRRIERLPLVPQKAIALPAKKAIVEDGEMLALAEQARVDLACDGRIVVRMSGTEPKVRVMVECKDAKKTEKWISTFTEFIERYTSIHGV